MELLKCEVVAEEILDSATELWQKNANEDDFFVIIQASNDPASEIYLKHKQEDAKKCNIPCRVVKIQTPEKETLSEASRIIAEIERKIGEYNRTPECCGIMLQLPLWGSVSHCQDYLADLIDPEKDVDGLTDYNQCVILTGNTPCHYPCTAKGILTLLDKSGFSYKGANIVVIGRSKLVGRPLAAMLSQRNATVTICHSKTKDLEKITRMSDCVITATGVSNLITSDHLRGPTVVVDVGICRMLDGTIRGDVVPTLSRNPVEGWGITPVPRGVGLLTRATLMYNVATAVTYREDGMWRLSNF